MLPIKLKRIIIPCNNPEKKPGDHKTLDGVDVHNLYNQEPVRGAIEKMFCAVEIKLPVSSFLHFQQPSAAGAG